MNQGDPMSFAYADPPYLGCGKRYVNDHPDALVWDDIETHRALVGRLTDEYPDGWAMSASSTSLYAILPLCPPGTRVAAWVKPFAAFKRNVRVAYTWEPVLVYGGRISSKDGAGVNRDHLAESITLRKGLTGAKPERFCRWVLDLLGWKPGDKVADLFPGTGVFDRVLTEVSTESTTQQGEQVLSQTISLESSDDVSVGELKDFLLALDKAGAADETSLKVTKRGAVVVVSYEVKTNEASDTDGYTPPEDAPVDVDPNAVAGT